MKIFWKYIIIVVAVAVAIVLWTTLHKNSSKPEWRTDNPSNGTIREVVTATGALNPYVLVEVGTEVSGKIEKLYKDYNDPVRKGDLLAKLDTELLMTSLESAKADVNKATISRDQTKMDFDIADELCRKNMTSEYEMKKAEYNYKLAQQTLANSQLNYQKAQKNLQNASITSPIDGVIVARNVNEGQTVAASMSSPTLFTIANNLDQMQISANVDEADIGKIKVEMPVEFTVDAYAGEQFNGSVKQIRLNSVTEQNVVSYTVIIDAANPGHKLLPGMTTNVSIIIQSKENVLRIPETATRFTPSKEVWELFGLKWSDDLITNARKKAMETMMASIKPQQGQSERKPDSLSRQRKPGAAPDSTRRGGFSRKETPGGSTQAGTERGTNNFDRGNGGFSRGGGRGFNRGGGGFASIWVLKDKKPELIMVRTGVSDGANMEILSQLDPNTEIITGVNYKDAKQAANNNSLQRGPGMGPRF
jgi:HlyD family secretion protein